MSSDDEVLSRCLDDRSQNENKAFNMMIWERCLKAEYFCGVMFEFGCMMQLLTLILVQLQQ